MKVHKGHVAVIMLGVAVILGGCNMEKIGTALENGLEDVKEMEQKGGPFENNIESARAYLLQQMKDKYGEEFFVTDNERLQNYGPLAGVSYDCNVAPVNAPEKIARALVSQTLYKKVNDNYARYYYNTEIETPVVALCKSKEYILEQKVSLEAMLTPDTWNKEQSAKQYISQTGGYLDVLIYLKEGLEEEVYAEQLLDFLESTHEFDINMTVNAKAGNTHIFYRQLKLASENPQPEDTVEELVKEIKEYKQNSEWLFPEK